MNAQPTMPMADYATSQANLLSGLLRWRLTIEKIINRYKSMITYNDVVHQVQHGNMYWFENPNAFIIIQPQTFTMGLVFHIWACGGPAVALWELFEGSVYPVARSHNARKITALARSGFKKYKHPFLKPTGQQWYSMEL